MVVSGKPDPSSTGRGQEGAIETRHRPSSVLMPSGYGFGRLSSTLEGWPGDSGWPALLYLTHRAVAPTNPDRCRRPLEEGHGQQGRYAHHEADADRQPQRLPTASDRGVVVGRAKEHPRRSEDRRDGGELSPVSVSAENGRRRSPDCCHPVISSPIRTAVYEGSAAVSRDLAGVQALWPRD